jgi:hypothetical protein
MGNVFLSPALKILLTQQQALSEYVRYRTYKSKGLAFAERPELGSCQLAQRKPAEKLPIIIYQAACEVVNRHLAAFVPA